MEGCTGEEGLRIEWGRLPHQLEVHSLRRGFRAVVRFYLLNGESFSQLLTCLSLWEVVGEDSLAALEHEFEVFFLADGLAA